MKRLLTILLLLITTITFGAGEFDRLLITGNATIPLINGDVTLTGSVAMTGIDTATASQASYMTMIDDEIYLAPPSVETNIVGPSANQVLLYSATESLWVNGNNPSGFADPMTATGSMIYRNLINSTVELLAGTTGQVLEMVTFVPTWTNTAIDNTANIATITASVLENTNDIIAISASLPLYAQLDDVTQTVTALAFIGDGSGLTGIISLPATASFIADTDENTKIETEQSLDENIIKFTASGSEVATMNASQGLTVTASVMTTGLEIDGNPIIFSPIGGLGPANNGHVLIWDNDHFTNSGALLPLSGFAGISEEQHVGEFVVDGGEVYYDVEATVGGDVHFFLAVGPNDEGLARFVLDCTTGAGVGGRARVQLTQGTATVPQLNYIYITEVSPPVSQNDVGVAQLVASTVPPTGAFGWIGRAVIADDTFQTSDGAYTHQRYDDNITRNSRGLISHEREKIRSLGATYISGITLTASLSAIDPPVLEFPTTSGTVSQMHPQAFPAFPAGSEFYVANDFTTKYTKVTNMWELIADANGDSILNTRYNIVIWGSVDGPTGDHKIFINLPDGTYSTDSGAIADGSNKGVTTVPAAFSQTAFLISKIAIRNRTTPSNTLQVLGITDLRGVPVGVNAGGSGGIQTEFSDDTFRVNDDGDSTKQLSFQVDKVPSGTTVELTVPTQSGTIALESDLSAYALLDDITQTVTALAFIGDGSGLTGLPSGFTDPMTSAGDMIGRNSGNTTTRIPPGSSGQVLTSNGAGLPTWQASGGGGSATALATFTLSSDMSKGDLVRLVRNGDVSNIDIILGGGVGTPDIFEPGTATFDIDIVSDTASSVAVVSKDGAASSIGVIAIGAVSGSNVTWQTPVVFDSGSILYSRIDHSTLDDVYAVFYRESGAVGFARLCKPSGLTVTCGARLQSTVGSIEAPEIIFDTSAGHFILGWVDSAANVLIRTLTVTGTDSFDLGDITNLDVGNSANLRGVHDSVNNLNAFVWSNPDSDCEAKTVTLTGTAIAIGASAICHAGTVGSTSIGFDKVTEKFITPFTNAGDASKGYAARGTLSGTSSLTFETAVLFNGSDTDYIGIGFDGLSQNLNLVYRDNGNSGNGTLQPVDTTGSSVTFGATTVYSTGDNLYNNIAFDPETNRNVCAYMDNGDRGSSTVFTTETRQDLYGVVQADGLAGESREVATFEEYSTIHDGNLTPSLKYYVQSDGSLGIDFNEYQAGISITASKLRVRD